MPEEITVKLTISKELQQVYQQADSKIKKLYGFAPGPASLMVLNLAKELPDEIVKEFSNAVKRIATARGNRSSSRVSSSGSISPDS